MGGHLAHMGEMKNIYNILVGELERKRQIVKPMSKWNDIKMYFKEI
jgi:hypothetical protein